MTGSPTPGQDLATRLDEVSLTLLFEDRKRESFHLPPELTQLVSDHALWAYVAVYATHVSRKFLKGLRRGLKLPDADSVGEDVGTAVSSKVAGLREAMAQRRGRSTTAAEQDARELSDVITGINSEPIDESARRTAQDEFRDSLRKKGATARQAEKIADEVDRTIFDESGGPSPGTPRR